MSRCPKILFLIYCLVYPAALLAANGELLPSEVTVLINHAMRANSDVERKTLTTPIVARMQTDELSEIERFMKGEVHFLHFQPQASRDEFLAFRDRDDDLGRVANQRLMTIRINAFQMVDELVNDDIPIYRRRFGPRIDDRFGITFPITNTANQLAARGDVDDALDLIVAEVRAHDQFDGPYTAYGLAGQFMHMAVDAGRGEEFLQLNKWVLNGLTRTIESRLKVHDHGGGQTFDVPGTVFFTLFDDRRLGYHDWTAKFMRLRDRIAAGGGN